jgi:hypothetical protein
VSGAPAIRAIEVTHFTLYHIIPFGYELDVEFEDADHLAFGFWSRDGSDRAQRFLRRISAPAA